MIPLSETPIYAQLRQEQFSTSIRESFARVQSVLANHATAMQKIHQALQAPQYPAEVHELSRTTGWSLEESADMYQRVAKWASDAITKADLEALNRSRMNKPNHYPTSTPAWSRKKPRK